MAGNLGPSAAPGLGLRPAEILSGLRDRQFELHYQPLVDLRHDRICGFEALVRWRHPKHGLIRPAVFVPLAEEGGVIQQLGDWTISRACRQLHAWRSRRPQASELVVSVNLSTLQLLDAELPDRVARLLRELEMPADRLRLEMTESALVRHVEQASDVLGALQRLGVRLSVDDFGTGYVSLAYLSAFPVDTLKIDRSLIRDLDGSSERTVLVAELLQLAREMGLAVVAEGIERRAELERLRSLGCRFVQGFHFSHPLPAEAAERLISDSPEASI